jgi:hypothetical protein
MAISDRTRKFLWGRAANRCAICRQELTIAAADAAGIAQVGEECHIVARSPFGPRGSSAFVDDPEGYENLILLCGTHHKLIDDLPGEYTPERLSAVKSEHEHWVEVTLRPKKIPPRIRLFKAEGEAEAKLDWIQTGKDLVSVVYRCCSSYCGSDDLESEAEAELVGELLQEVEDLDVYGCLGAKEKVRTEFRITRLLQELQDSDFFVFAARFERTIEIGRERKKWPVVFVHVLRASNPTLQRIA